jgi:hypothetical protein
MTSSVLIVRRDSYKVDESRLFYLSGPFIVILPVPLLELHSVP